MTKENLEKLLVEYGVAFTDCLADRLLKEFNVKTGSWKMARCSECGYMDVEEPNYCPNCGTKMKEEVE